ncbi:hypothetical protein BDY21DRAFT_311622 [Lineolata rhizophorae]|uniref:Uncharacterized protein n=1 Tax=Lineolata rhizophorae TaxID=578093 RepID=A0A6A6NLZ6_9PEZI|nr:hypothetical protein BDY21DRAFT_311622 [Lineolata rhizophorae]
MGRTSLPTRIVPTALLALCFTFVASVAAAQEPLGGQDGPQYMTGDPIPVTCLNRTIDTGEHITDEQGQLQYVPFPVCNETGRPLEILFGVEREMNCTLSFISDEFFHLLEFYVHNDAPLTCRIPSRPLFPYPDTSEQVGALGTQSTAYTPLIMALTGTLQLSHIHINSRLNMLVHTAGTVSSAAAGVIDAAAAYSVAQGDPEAATRIVVGSDLPLTFSVRWYPSTQLPGIWVGGKGIGGHVYLSTFVYCVLSAGVSAVACVVYFRGVELPRRLRRYGRERTFAGVGGGYNGYGYGVGNGYGIGTSKRE